MSQSIRRVLAVTGLVAALLLSMPAPSRAAGFYGQAPAASFVARAWSWLEGLLASSGTVAAIQQPAIQQKTVPTFPPPPPVPPTTTTGSGSMIDPDGIKR